MAQNQDAPRDPREMADKLIFTAPSWRWKHQKSYKSELRPTRRAMSAPDFGPSVPHPRKAPCRTDFPDAAQVLVLLDFRAPCARCGGGGGDGQARIWEGREGGGVGRVVDGGRVGCIRAGRAQAGPRLSRVAFLIFTLCSNFAESSKIGQFPQTLSAPVRNRWRKALTNGFRRGRKQNERHQRSQGRLRTNSERGTPKAQSRP